MKNGAEASTGLANPCNIVLKLLDNVTLNRFD
jgi:hypothetical protein